MSKFQIEKVDHTCIYSNTVCLQIGYYKNLDCVAQFNYSSEQKCRESKDMHSVGMWKIKKYEF